MLVRDGYDHCMPNAYLSTRLGYLHGFQKIGMPTEFVEYGKLVDFITTAPSVPLLWLTSSDYYHLGPGALEAVRPVPSS